MNNVKVVNELVKIFNEIHSVKEDAKFLTIECSEAKKYGGRFNDDEAIITLTLKLGEDIIWKDEADSGEYDGDIKDTRNVIHGFLLHDSFMESVLAHKPIGQLAAA